jgi:hypothetical protein
MKSVRAGFVGVFLSLAAALPAWAGDLTVFAGLPSPRDSWGRAYGASLTSTLVPVIGFEGEAARVSGGNLDTAMTSFTASAVVSPPIGLVTPYGGVGAGVFRQTLTGGISDTGRLTALFGGVKVKAAGILVLKAEYRKISLSGNPPIRLDRRISIGAGVSF